MKIFVNNILFEIKKNAKSANKYSKVFDSTEKIDFIKLKNQVLVKKATIEECLDFFKIIRKNPPLKLKSLTILSDEKDKIIRTIKEKYMVIRAAGGVVHNADSVLLIFRLGKWDLPKGKLNFNETSKKGAIREVEEECNIKASIERKICDTWHVYKNSGGKKMLKKTKWYSMSCLDDRFMKPETKEGIEQVCWVKKQEEIDEYLDNTYASIKHVLRHFKKQQVSFSR